MFFFEQFCEIGNTISCLRRRLSSAKCLGHLGSSSFCIGQNACQDRENMFAVILSDAWSSRARLVVDSWLNIVSWHILWRNPWIDLHGVLCDDNSAFDFFWSCLLVFCTRTYACILSFFGPKGMHSNACFALSCRQLAELNSSAPCRRRIAEKTSPICTWASQPKMLFECIEKTWTKLDKPNSWWEWIIFKI